MIVIRLPRYDGRIAPVAGIMTNKTQLLLYILEGSLLPLYCCRIRTDKTLSEGGTVVVRLADSFTYRIEPDS